MELTIHTGLQGEHSTINLEWHDENNRVLKDEIIIIVKEQDKPRILEILINGVKLTEINSRYKSVES